MGPSRRTSGALLITLVIVGALAAAGLTNRGVPGLATMAPIPDAPKAGSCVLDPIVGGDGYDLVEIGDGVARVGPYAQQTFGDCRTAHFGELVQVFAHRTHTVAVATDPTQPPFAQPVELTRCSLAAEAFIGGLDITASPGQFGDWQPVTSASSALVDPSPLQQAAGQDWVACVVGEAPNQGSGTGSVQPYIGTLRNALATGQRDQYGQCYADEMFSQTVPCRQPHLFETFGLQAVRRPLSLSIAQDTCRNLVLATTKRPGLLEEGPVSTVITSFDSFGQAVVPLPPTIRVGTLISCAISARPDQSLVGSLLDIGKAPLPVRR